MKKGIGIFILFVTSVATAPAQQIEPRVAGLGGNAEYMGLLGEERSLRQREDSLGSEIMRVRELFRTDTSARAELSNDILRLEGEIFDVRNRTGIVAGRIGSIEERYIISNLTGGRTTDGGDDVAGQQPREAGVPDLVRNRVFADNLSAGDYRVLLDAQSREGDVGRRVAAFMDNYRRIAALAAVYPGAARATEADSIYAQYIALKEANDALEADIADGWTYIFDNKMYSYNYVLEKRGEQRALGTLNDMMREAREKAIGRGEGVESESVALYFVYKRLALNVEAMLAGQFGLARAADSLARARADLDRIEAPIPTVPVTERLFIEYDNIQYINPSRYNNSNPVPECTVYARGRIYRILLGTYTVRQAVAIFKGAYPLSYVRQADGKFAYYAGGYRDYAGARAAAEELRRRGVRAAKVAMWNNGQYTLLEEGDSGALYRIEIGGAGDALPAAVREAIGAAAPGKDLSRAGSAFYVGPFDSSAGAETAAEAIRQSDAALEVSISQIER